MNAPGDDSRHWSQAAALVARPPYRLWREHSDAVNLDLARRWLGAVARGRVLKTDLFDEAVGRGVCGGMRDLFPAAYGIDLSCAVARRARTSSPEVSAVAGDVRRVPFASECFDAVVSLSSLDHFASVADIAVSLREIHRVLRPGGHLLLTLDNPSNPKILLRNALPASIRDAGGLVPYHVGKSLGPRPLVRELTSSGFEVLELGAVVHCPRILAVAASRLLARASPFAAARFRSVLLRFEALGRLPTRSLTGHFTAILARRSPRPEGAAP